MAVGEVGWGRRRPWEQPRLGVEQKRKDKKRRRTGRDRERERERVARICEKGIPTTLYMYIIRVYYGKSGATDITSS